MLSALQMVELFTTSLPLFLKLASNIPVNVVIFTFECQYYLLAVSEPAPYYTYNDWQLLNVLE